MPEIYLDDRQNYRRADNTDKPMKDFKDVDIENLEALMLENPNLKDFLISLKIEQED